MITIEDMLVYLGLLILLPAFVFLIFKCFRTFFERVTVYEYERGLRYRKGKYAGILLPGTYIFFRPYNHVFKVDVRPQILTITGQEILSDGNIPVKLSLAAKFRVTDFEWAHTKTNDWYEAMYLLLQLNLRRLVASLSYDDLLKNRGELVQKLLAENAAPLAELGIELISVDVKDVILPADIKKAYAQVLLARQEGVAALEKARGETAALRNLANAAKMLENNPALYQLRLLQSLSEVKGSTLVIGAQGLFSATDKTKLESNNVQ
jgi:regulator of protease activity HflC (stomatin/prohibitin superfamily)